MKRITTTIQITQEQYDALCTAARRNRLTLERFCELALEQGLEDARGDEEAWEAAWGRTVE